MFDVCLQRIGIGISILFSSVAFGLLLVGCGCHYNRLWISDQGFCESVYITGMILSFLVAMAAYFSFMFWFIEWCAGSVDAATAPAAATRQKRFSVDSPLKKYTVAV
jgi:hypothetical protein